MRLRGDVKNNLDGNEDLVFSTSEKLAVLLFQSPSLYEKDDAAFFVW